MTQEQRFGDLERQTGRLRSTATVFLLVALVALIVCLGLLATGRARTHGTTRPAVVTGTEFRLVDSNGITRAVLAMENGHPLLRFLNERGEFRAAVGLEDYGPSLFFARANGRPGTSIGVGPKGPAMAFGDSAGNVRILFNVDETGAPKLALRDTFGHGVWTAP
jgi:hypothetical protein